MLIKSVLFWDITQRRAVVVYRRFGIMYLSHFKVQEVQEEKGPICCPETTANNYNATLHNIAEERRSYIQCCYENLMERDHLKYLGVNG
jgi:hypothetical protein